MTTPRTTFRTLVTLWLPVPVFAAAGWLLATGDLAVQDGVADLDPLFGLATLFIIAVTGCGGLVSLVVAVVGSASRSTRATATLANAIWTACLLVPFTLHLVVSTYAEPMYEDSTALGQQVPYQVAAGLLALLPLGLALWERRRPAAEPTATSGGRHPTPAAR